MNIYIYIHVYVYIYTYIYLYIYISASSATCADSSYIYLYKYRVSCETLDSAPSLCSVSPIMKCLSVIELLHIMSCETLHSEGAPSYILVCDTAQC